MALILKNKITSLVLVIFSILVVSEILLFNEEAIVAFCTLIFVLIAYEPISDAIASELNEKITKIKKEFNFKVRGDRLNLLINYYPKIEYSFKKITEIYMFYCFQKRHILTKIQLILVSNILLELQQKLRTIQLKQLAVLKQIQLEIISFFSVYIPKRYILTKNTAFESLMMEKHVKNTVVKYNLADKIEKQLLHVAFFTAEK